MLELILGPMYAGKTTELLKRRSGKTLIINHSLDTRTGDSVKTHDGVESAALKCSVLPDAAGYDTVLIDEGQFFASLKGVESLAPNVVVAGLSGDFMRRPFGQILNLIPKASKVTFLNAECSGCGDCAQFTKRLSPGIGVYSVDASYVPTCNECYTK